jgi:hypothetical protein
VIWVIGIAVMVLGPASALFGWRVRRTPVWLGALVITLIVTALWWGNLLLVASNAGDLSGIMDCDPYCSGTQKTSQFVLWDVPLFMAVFLVSALAGLAWRRRSRSS